MCAPTHAHGLRLAPQLNRQYSLPVTARIQRNQVNLRFARTPNAILRRGPSPTTTTEHPSPTCGPYGKQPDTASCAGKTGSLECTDEYYDVSPSGVTLAGGRTFVDGGHVNLAYIPVGDYQGTGSYANRPANWHVSQVGIHFERLNNQPSGQFIGKSTLPYSYFSQLPAEGFCIVWVSWR